MSEPRHTASNPKSLVGTIIAGRYEVIKELGAGGMGVVLRAKQIAMNREVALKVLHPQFSQNRQAAARFHREMQVTSKLEHANTIRVYDFGETEDGQLYLAMELVPGKTLSELLGAQPVTSTTPRQDETDLVVRTGLPLPRLVHIARQIAVALKAAHGEGIVHRDLKPDNVMLIDRYGDKDTVKVLDFGIARFADESAESQRLTAEGAVVGTPAYMSPEQATGRPVGPATDIYAFGVILFEMATGTIPFSAPTTVSLMVMHVQEPPPRPSTVAPVDPRLEQLILRCLAKDPADRPASAEEIIAALDQLVSPATSAPGKKPTDPSSAPPGGTGPTPPAKKGSKLPLILALLVLIGVGVALAVVFSQGGTKPTPPEPIAVNATPDTSAEPPSTSGDTAPADAAATDTAATEADTTHSDAALAQADTTADAAPDTSPDTSGDAAAASDSTDAQASDTLADAANAANGPADGTAAQADTVASPRASLEAIYERAEEPAPPEPCRASDPALLAALSTAAEHLRPRSKDDPPPADNADTLAYDALRAAQTQNADLFANSAEAQALFAKATLKAVSLPAEALPFAQRATELCPDWAFTHNALGNVQQAMTDLDEARRAYTRATTLAPTWGVPRFNLALIELSAKQPVAAIAVLDRLLTDHPDWDNGHLLRAQARLMARDAKTYPLAEADALRATELTPTEGRAFFMLGEARRAQKLDAAAKEAYCKAKELGHGGAAKHCP